MQAALHSSVLMFEFIAYNVRLWYVVCFCAVCKDAVECVYECMIKGMNDERKNVSVLSLIN